MAAAPALAILRPRPERRLGSKLALAASRGLSANILAELRSSRPVHPTRAYERLLSG